jgi:hypothetical protein
MAYTPLIQAALTITCKDINNNSVVKTFNQVLAVNIDYAFGRLNVVDAAQGSLYFPLSATTTWTYIANTTLAPKIHTLTIT